MMTHKTRTFTSLNRSSAGRLAIRMLTAFCIPALALTAACTASAAVFGGNPFPYDLSTTPTTFQLTDGGITATFTVDTADTDTANDNGNNFIASEGGFLGVQGGAGGPDIGNNESFTLIFDTDVFLESVTLHDNQLRFYDGDSIDFTAPGGGTTTSFPAGMQLTANTPLFVDTDGMRAEFQQITVTAVPEPSSVAVLLAGLGLLIMRWRGR